MTSPPVASRAGRAEAPSRRVHPQADAGVVARHDEHRAGVRGELQVADVPRDRDLNENCTGLAQIVGQL
jgi:hypothetical protein